MLFFFILNYAILFVRVVVAVNFINKFCSRFPTAYLSGSANTAMAFSYSFQSRTGTSCSYDRLDKNKSLEIISLCNCSKDITGHCSHLSFSGITTESELILSRVGVFSEDETSSQKLDTICSYHRRELGFVCWRNSIKCNVPQIISKHGANRKADRSVSKMISERILKTTGEFVPVGSGELRFKGKQLFISDLNDSQRKC